MSTSTSLHHRLAESGSVTSLRAELAILRALRGQRWRCYHGAFYLDPNEYKLRELDVLARRFWRRQRRDREELARLDMLVEAKGAKDWQVVFSEETPGGETPGYVGRVWCGQLGQDRYPWLRAALASVGLGEARIATLLAQFQRQAFPNVFARMPIFVEPPPAEHIVTAFRETNTDKEKDLENSVLWRGISALRSATSALELACEQWHAGWFADPELRTADDREALSRFRDIATRSLGFVDMFHAVVVLDAGLWLTASHSLKRVPWCRFHQLDHIGSVTWWCDVVQSSAFPAYARVVSAHYAKEFARRGGRAYRISDR